MVTCSSGISTLILFQFGILDFDSFISLISKLLSGIYYEKIPVLHLFSNTDIHTYIYCKHTVLSV